MTGHKFVLSRKALADLDAIWEYTVERWSEQQAEKYYRLLIHACQEAANAPASGAAYDLILPGLRGLHAGRHIIFYRLKDTVYIEVARILHERMDLPSRLKE